MRHFWNRWRTMRCGIAGIAALSSSAALAQETRQRDLFDDLIDANRAQVIMLSEQDLLEDVFAKRLLQALTAIETDTVSRDPDYLALEADLIARLGPDASNIHLGRSRNDLTEAMFRMDIRRDLLHTLQVLGQARAALLDLAEANLDTVYPGMTHAVQAQPTTLGHVLLAFDAHLERDADRLRSAYNRLNQSPLGAAALTTSGFPTDRERLATLLGFDGVVVNSYDAIVLASGESKLEVMQAAELSALAVGRFAQDLLFQYGDAAPGLVLSDDVAGRSSIMPQKRNPGSIERLRVAASEVVGLAMTGTVYAHNTPMHEVRDTRAPLYEKTVALLAQTNDMYGRLQEVLETIRVDRARLAAIVAGDYAAMTEIADTLFREAGVAFRDGYAFASAMTTYGRTVGKTPGALSHDEASQVYRDTVGQPLPLSPEQFATALDAAAIVANRKGLGGPQIQETTRMLAAARQANAGLIDFVNRERSELSEARTGLMAEAHALSEGR